MLPSVASALSACPIRISKMYGTPDFWAGCTLFALKPLHSLVVALFFPGRESFALFLSHELASVAKRGRTRFMKSDRLYPFSECSGLLHWTGQIVESKKWVSGENIIDPPKKSRSNIFAKTFSCMQIEIYVDLILIARGAVLQVQGKQRC